MPKKLTIFTDGGARGNPGPAATGFLILSETGQVLMAKSRYLGSRTNNQAEYEALITALESAMKLQADEVACHLDSQLVVRQITGEYRVKNPELRKNIIAAGKKSVAEFDIDLMVRQQESLYREMLGE